MPAGGRSGRIGGYLVSGSVAMYVVTATVRADDHPDSACSTPSVFLTEDRRTATDVPLGLTWYQSRALLSAGNSLRAMGQANCGGLMVSSVSPEPELWCGPWGPSAVGYTLIVSGPATALIRCAGADGRRWRCARRRCLPNQGVLRLSRNRASRARRGGRCVHCWHPRPANHL